MPAENNSKIQSNNKSFTTGRVFLLNAKRQILTIKETRRKGQPLTYPGGKCEGNETTRECAIRETKEATGIDISTSEFNCIGQVQSRDTSKTEIFVYETTTMPPANPRSQWAEKENKSKFGPNVYAPPLLPASIGSCAR